MHLPWQIRVTPLKTRDTTDDASTICLPCISHGISDGWPRRVSLLPTLPPMILQKWSFGVCRILTGASISRTMGEAEAAPYISEHWIYTLLAAYHFFQSPVRVCLCVVPRAVTSLPANHEDDIRVRQVRIQSAIDNHLQREITYRQ